MKKRIILAIFSLITSVSLNSNAVATGALSIATGAGTLPGVIVAGSGVIIFALSLTKEDVNQRRQGILGGLLLENQSDSYTLDLGTLLQSSVSSGKISSESASAALSEIHSRSSEGTIDPNSLSTATQAVIIQSLQP